MYSRILDTYMIWRKTGIKATTSLKIELRSVLRSSTFWYWHIPIIVCNGKGPVSHLDNLWSSFFPLVCHRWRAHATYLSSQMSAKAGLDRLLLRRMTFRNETEEFDRRASCPRMGLPKWK